METAGRVCEGSSNWPTKDSERRPGCGWSRPGFNTLFRGGLQWLYRAQRDLHRTDLARSLIVDAGAQPELPLGDSNAVMKLHAGLPKNLVDVRLDVEGDQVVLATGNLAVSVVDDERDVQRSLMEAVRCGLQLEV